MNRNPSNSRLETAFACRLSNVLPQAQTSTVHAAAGTVGHRFMERIVALQAPHPTEQDPDNAGLPLEEARDVAIAEAPELYRDALRLIPLDSLRELDLDPARCAVEVAYAYDVEQDTARELGRGVERAYGELTDTEYPGTTDYVALVGVDGVRIRDYKMGWGKPVPAERNIQLRKCALDACRAYGRSFADVEILRAPLGVVPWYDGPVRLNAYDIDRFAAELRDLHEQTQHDREAYAKGDLPPADRGDHCTYCPSLPYCPAQGYLLRSLVEGESEAARLVAQGKEGAAALITPDNAPRILELYQQARTVLDVVEGALRIHASQSPIPLRDGQVWGPRPDRKREVVNVDVAKAILEKELGKAAVAAALAPPKVTLEGLKAAVRTYFSTQPVKPAKGAIGKKDEELEAALHKAGALRIYNGATFIAFRPKDEP